MVANYPGSMPSATPATHGEVVDEIRAIAADKAISVKYGSGLWYSPPYMASISSQTQAVGDVRLYQVDFPPGATITGLAINVVTAGSAGATKTLLIYNDDGATSYPTTLQKATSALATTTTGVKSETFAAEAVGGTRWLGTLTLTNTCVLSGCTSGYYGIGATTITIANGPWIGYTQTGQTSAPATFTSTRTPNNGVDRVFFQIG